MYITASEARNNVKQFEKNFGTSKLKEVLELIETTSKNGAKRIILREKIFRLPINKKDYYILKRNGFEFKFSATYEQKQISKFCTEVKRREISLQEFFDNNGLVDKEVEIIWG